MRTGLLRLRTIEIREALEQGRSSAADGFWFAHGLRVLIGREVPDGGVIAAGTNFFLLLVVSPRHLRVVEGYGLLGFAAATTAHGNRGDQGHWS